MRPPESWARARVTLAIAGAAALVAFVLWRLDIQEAGVIWGAFIPVRVGGAELSFALAPTYLTPLTSAFLHASILHLVLNLIILLFCGRAVENIIGPVGLLVLFVAGAYAAAAVQYATDSDSLVPMIGASGAVSAVVGTYAMLFGRNRVRVKDPRLALWLNALWLAAGWVALQLLVGFAINSGMQGGGVAIAAHIGGFLAGLLLAKPLLLLRYRRA